MLERQRKAYDRSLLAFCKHTSKVRLKNVDDKNIKGVIISLLENQTGNVFCFKDSVFYQVENYHGHKDKFTFNFDLINDAQCA